MEYARTGNRYGRKEKVCKADQQDEGWGRSMTACKKQVRRQGINY